MALASRKSQQQPQQESQKSYREILREEIEQGLREHQRPTKALLISGLSAGLDVSFSLFLIGVVYTLTAGEVSESGLRILTAAFYGIGFIFVVLGRSELFTEHTTLAVLPVLNRRSSMSSLARLWALVYIANLAGSAIFAALTSWIGLAQLHHSIVGSTEVLAGGFGGHGGTLGEYGATLLWATLGNAIGGVFFVAIIKYSHVMQSGGAHEKSAE